MNKIRSLIIATVGLSFFLLAMSLVSYQAASGSAPSRGTRKFYLTQNRFNGAQAPTACAGDYHMASLWEIFDTSNLRYDTALGLALEDSGSGPPTGSPGWIRTGFVATSNAASGQANCWGWTSREFQDFGTQIDLHSIWETVPDQPAISWQTGIDTCSSQFPVWCVED